MDRTPLSEGGGRWFDSSSGGFTLDTLFGARMEQRSLTTLIRCHRIGFDSRLRYKGHGDATSASVPVPANPTCWFAVTLPLTTGQL